MFQRFTPLGLHFAMIGCCAMFGGALQGLNLMLLIAGLLVGGLLMQWRWSRRSVEAAAVRRALPTEAFAGRQVTIRYLMRNRSARVPIWMMRVIDPIADGRDRRVENLLGVGVVPGGRTTALLGAATFRERGEYRFGPLSTTTRFPFALLECGRRDATEESFVVYPALGILRRGWQRVLSTRPGGITAAARRVGGSDGEFFGLRGWRSGDSRRMIHWRSTARRDEPTVRQFEQHQRLHLCFVLDAHGDDVPEAASGRVASTGDTRPTSPGDPLSLGDPFEYAVSLTATLVVGAAAAVGNRITLAVPSSIRRAGGSVLATGGERDDVLRPLALVRPSDNPGTAGLLREAMDESDPNADFVIISPRSRELALLQSPDLVAVLSGDARARRVRWVDATAEGASLLVQADASVDNLGEKNGAAVRYPPTSIGADLPAVDASLTGGRV